jgi:hypothetical protein
MTALEQLILLNLYQQQTKKTGIIDLPDIEVLVNGYKDQKNLTNLSTNTVPENNPQLQNQPSQDNTNPSLNYQNINQKTESTTNNITNNNTNINAGENESETITMKAEISDNSEHKKPTVDKPKKKIITQDMENLILELYLQEIAENLVNPSDKALNPILQGDLETLLSTQ